LSECQYFCLEGGEEKDEPMIHTSYASSLFPPYLFSVLYLPCYWLICIRFDAADKGEDFDDAIKKVKEE